MSAEINAFVTRERRAQQTEGPLQGMRVAIKDNLSTAGIRTTCGSKMLAEYVSPFDATVVERVLDAGGEIVGKANMDEFGMGSTTETSAFGPTKNPIKTTHVPGGSSGGSAAAVAAGEADVALGTDTGGSVRNPAAFCGVVGIKPTYGLVSRYGLIAYAHSLEQVGPIGSTVSDTATLLDVISGPDDRDATCTGEGAESNYRASSEQPSIEGVSIGIPTDLIADAEEGVRDRFWDAMASLEAEGATWEEFSLPSLDHAVAAYYVLAMSEASSNLARYDGVRYGHKAREEGDWNVVFGRTRREGFGPEVTRRILLGTFALSAGYHDKYYEQAQAARSWITDEFERAFEEVDVIASPTMPVTPFKIGEALDDPLQMYLADANTVPVNLANLPAISVPIGLSDGLPVGAQLVGPKFSEDRLIRLAAGLEERI